jgi:hypothetical protein
MRKVSIHPLFLPLLIPLLFVILSPNIELSLLSLSLSVLVSVSVSFHLPLPLSIHPPSLCNQPTNQPTPRSHPSTTSEP